MQAQIIAALLSFFILVMPLQAAPLTQKFEKISLNRADVLSLTGSFKGIGKKRAEAIIAYRESHHGFKSIEELAEIKGIGHRFIEVNRDKLNETFVVD